MNLGIFSACIHILQKVNIPQLHLLGAELSTSSLKCKWAEWKHTQTATQELFLLADLWCINCLVRKAFYCYGFVIPQSNYPQDEGKMPSTVWGDQ